MNMNAPSSALQFARPERRCFIAGQWVDGCKTFKVHDKFDGRLLAEVHEPSEQQVNQAITDAEAAFHAGCPEPVDRAAILNRAADLLAERRKAFAEVMTAEAGFVVADAENEVDRAGVTLRLCAEEATRLTGEMVSLAATRGQHNRLGFTLRVPVGLVCAITPFNSPLNTVLHKVGPAFAAGNAVILKAAAMTPLTAAMLCELLLDAGYPPRLLCLLQGSGSTVGNWLLQDSRIQFYTFTGSTEVGRKIREGAGLRRCQLELGSIASTIICADADLERAVQRTANAAFRKAGQVCTSTQRLFVEASVYHEVTAAMVKAATALGAGDPRLPDSRVGPMISEEAAKRAELWVNEAQASGAKLLCGGKRNGAVLQPSVLTDVKSGMKVIDEEIFAPVVSIIPFTTLDDAFAQANDTPYGLSTGIFTANIGRALAASKALRFGSVHINEASSARADAMPFGGVKDSGFGHEGPAYAIKELTEVRMITMLP